jgi:hypothetical protein
LRSRWPPCGLSGAAVRASGDRIRKAARKKEKVCVEIREKIKEKKEKGCTIIYLFGVSCERG